MKKREKHSGFFPCPCCGLPTLTERGSYDICTICWWEDDGQDDDRADEVWGGPNGKYSLTHARINFANHGYMYDAGEGIGAVRNPSLARIELVSFAQKIIRGQETLDVVRLQALIAADRASWPKTLGE